MDNRCYSDPQENRLTTVYILRRILFPRQEIPRHKVRPMVFSNNLFQHQEIMPKIEFTDFCMIITIDNEVFTNLIAKRKRQFDWLRFYYNFVLSILTYYNGFWYQVELCYQFRFYYQYQFEVWLPILKLFWID